MQIDIAKRVFSPDPADVAHARRVIEAMGDGTGAVMLDGKMEDDASVKQCQVMVDLAEAAGRQRDPELAKLYADDAAAATGRTDRSSRPILRPRRSVLYMPGANERALEKAKGLPADALILDLEDAVAPDAKAEARDRVCAAARRASTAAARSTIRVNGLDTEWHADDLAGRRRGRAGRRRRAQGQLGRRRRRHREGASRPAAPRTTRRSGRCSRRRSPCSHAEEIAAPPSGSTVLVMGTNDLAKELHAEHVPGRQPLLAGLALCLLAARAAGKVILDGVYNDIKDARRLRGRVPCRAGRWASTARR